MSLSFPGESVTFASGLITDTSSSLFDFHSFIQVTMVSIVTKEVTVANMLYTC